jgi:hypothetical protein
MNPNQNLIDYQKQLLQINLDQINFLNFEISTVQRAISSANESIVFFDGQIGEFNNEIGALEAGNVLINQTIDILTAS